MDAVSHALFGHTLAVSLVRQPRRAGVTGALVLGSLLPDIDIGLAPRAFDLYLRAHQAGTHALPGTCLGAMLLALALRALVRKSRYWPLFLASWAGTLGHVFWDLADDGDIKVFDPLSGVVFGWHLVAMAEPAVLIPLLFVTCAAWWWPLRARPVAVAVLCSLAALLSVKVVSQTLARARYTQVVAPDPAGSVEVVPARGSLSGWTIYDRAHDQVRAWHINSRSGVVELQFERYDATGDPEIVASRDLPVVRTFLRTSTMPFVRIERDGSRRVALWSDIRWCSRDSCDVSFGGAFDGGMRPLYQIIEIGGFQQRRNVGK